MGGRGQGKPGECGCAGAEAKGGGGACSLRGAVPCVATAHPVLATPQSNYAYDIAMSPLQTAAYDKETLMSYEYFPASPS